MSLEKLKFRVDCANLTRKFFSENNYLEIDPPSFSKYVIPESSIEIFQVGKYFLLPSPEVYIKKLLSIYKCSMFSLSHCFRAEEIPSSIHSPEFTMLEYYTVNADYMDSIAITEKFFHFLVDGLKTHPAFDKEQASILTKPFLRLTMDEAFIKYANFSLAQTKTREQLLQKVKQLKINESSTLENYTFKDLYELVLVAVIEPALPKNEVVALIDYPALSETLSKRKTVDDFPVTERWEIYVNGVELANCYTELTDASAVKNFFDNEMLLRKKANMTEILPPPNFDEICGNLPNSSGVALGFERLLMLLTGSKSIDGFIVSL